MTELSGVIEKIIYQNDKNGFTVAVFETTDDNDQTGIQTTVTGIMPKVKKGTPLNIKGNWIEHKDYGEQFQVESFSPLKPNSKKNLETFLLSGSIPGISKRVAQRIINACGDNFMKIIEKNPQELLKIKGLGKKTLDKIIHNLRDESENLEVLAQFQDLGIPSHLAKRIMETYKDKALNIVLDDPFDLALSIQGIGFIRADEIAQKVGFDENNNKRIIAGIIYTLMDCYRSGHTYLEREELLNKAQRLLKVDKDLIEHELADAIFSGKIYESFLDDQPIYYPVELYKAESDSALKLYELSRDNVHDDNLNLDLLIENVQKDLGIILDPTQIEAIKSVTENPITIITGGPGTGKSATCSVVN